MEKTIVARCDNVGDYGCSWDYNGARSYIEADNHTARTGHATVVIETIRTTFTKEDLLPADTVPEVESEIEERRRRT